MMLVEEGNKNIKWNSDKIDEVIETIGVIWLTIWEINKEYL